MPWTDAQKQVFLRMQFDAQDAYFRQSYPDGRFLVVTRDNKPIGRLYVVRLADEIRLVDIALLPKHRGAGIGSRLLADVVAEAAQAGLPVRLYVEHGNPARRLYERFGFESVETGSIYELMELPRQVIR